ncbi:hypothetical protein SCOR_03300 [Sulfidibacter corallicola]|uniref:DUF3298 domain-containing protein n=1 Tax=Sulfidibacter corallicola TaxID=2818388 RepID=A0A8A4TFN0_SULCO|nr:hypothetical protein [Sulfidibacter corallicola]QTD48443.1 hypothetical protein J3U87_22925 [Sulfidibacter corallicola]
MSMTLLFLFTISVQENIWTNYYVGTIGDSNKIQMSLSGNLDSDDVLRGSYFYEKHGIPLDLRPKGNDLVEYHKGDPTGRFPLIFEKSESEFQGTWQSADKKRQLPFHLKRISGSLIIRMDSDFGSCQSEVPDFFGAGSALKAWAVQRQAHEIKKQVQSLTESELQQLEGPIKSGFTISYTIHYYSEALVSLNIEHSHYSGPLYAEGRSALILVVSDGTVKELQLGDLLLPGAEAKLLSRLSGALEESLAARDGDEPMTTEDFGDIPFLITPLHIRFIFDRDPDNDAIFPYRDLVGLLDPQSTVGRFLPKTDK